MAGFYGQMAKLLRTPHPMAKIRTHYSSSVGPDPKSKPQIPSLYFIRTALHAGVQGEIPIHVMYAGVHTGALVGRLSSAAAPCCTC